MKLLRRMTWAALLLGSLSSTQAQTTNFLAWTFDNLAAAVNNTPNPSIGSGTATALGMSNSYNGTTSITTADVLSDPGSSTGTAGPNAWRIRGQSPGNGWSTQAPIGTQGAEFAGSTVGFSSIKITFDLHTTAQAEANLAVFYTTNGGSTWSNAHLAYAGSGAVIKTNTTSTNTVFGTYIQFQNTLAPWYNGITVDLSGIAAVTNNPSFAIKLVNASTGADDINQAGTVYNNSSGNWRYDNVIFSGTPGSAKPTPSFSGLTASQIILTGTVSIALAGKVSAAGPLYPSLSESLIITINGTSRTNAFGDAMGDFSLTFPTATIPAGSYAISYSYPGNATLNPAANSSTGLTVTNGTPPANVPPSVSLTNPLNSATFTAPATLVLAANASDSDGIVTNVAFYQGGTKLANVSTSPYSYIWSGVAAGAYSLTAVATDNLGASTTSSVVNVTVTNLVATSAVQSIRTVFVIACENHNFIQPTPGSSPQQILGNPAAPYVNSLITPGNPNAVQVSYAMHYYNAGVGVHGSEPNYIWSEAGTDFGIHTSSDPSSAAGNIFTCQHLTSQLNAAGIPWKDYQEDVQYSTSPIISAAGTGSINAYNGSTQYSYAVKHNPMAFFSDTQLQNVSSLSNLVSDLASNNVGRYNWITPDLFNEMHSSLDAGFTYQGIAYTGDQAAVAEGDNFLSKMIPLIMASSAYKSNGVIIIWFDETEGEDTTNYPMPEIIISPLAKGNAYASPVVYSHSSDLKTMEEIFGLSFVTNAIPSAETTVFGTGYNNVATVNDFSDMLMGQPHLIIQQSGMTLTNGSGTLAWGTVNVDSNVTQSLIITNSGIATLVLSNIITTGTNAGDFAVSGITLPASVAVGSSVALNVIFSPTACGARSATLQITDNEALNSPFTLFLTGFGNTAPLIVSQPASLTNQAGTTASFTVGATACTSINYQWYLGTNLLPGATSSTLTIPSVGPANAGNYHVVVNSTGGSTNSSLATLTVTYQVPNIMGEESVLGNGSVQLTFAGPTGQTYQVLASEDLTVPRTDWTVVETGAFGITNIIFTDLAATNYPQRFYIIKSP